MVQNYFLTNAHLSLLHSRLRVGKKEKARGGGGGGGGGEKNKKKKTNHFGAKVILALQ